jgi:uncharacterized repeat protein (TIGR03803 family)
MKIFGSLRTVCMIYLLCVATAVAAHAQTYSKIATFYGYDGAGPSGALVQATNGALYGTTLHGGPNECDVVAAGSVHCGTIFKLAHPGDITRLASFDGTDGSLPNGGLVQATNGNFYGTTSNNGANAAGTVFEITAAGALTSLYSFCSQPGCTDGEFPVAGLVQGTDGNFYGTTQFGGANSAGTVFQITPAGVLTTLHSFCSQPSCADGGQPLAGLIQGTDGNFYGTTSEGGTGVLSGGTVFEITSAGALTTVYSFCSQTNCTDGSTPFAGVIQATDGNFYGTTSGGGTGGIGLGTAFKLTPEGALTTLHNFCSQTGCSDGEEPMAALVQATDGNFYGTSGGGTNFVGTIFKITSGGELTTLHNFCSKTNCTDGAGPGGALIQAMDGNFYGVAGGGAVDCYCGVVFRLSVGLAPVRRD